LRFIITGGGTGGHIYPALAIAKGLREKYPQAKILYVGKEKGLEANLAPAAGFAFRSIAVKGLKRSVSLENFLVLGQAGIGFFQAWRIITQFKPSAVIGTGGYVCGPVLMAAIFLRVPTMIHEQNALPGITNRILARFAGLVAISFAGAARHFPRGSRIKLTGLPVQPEFLQDGREQARQALGLPAGGFLVVSFGGSQGARSINRVMPEVIKKFKDRKDVHFLHATGAGHYEEFSRGFTTPENGNNTIKPYLYEMPQVLAAADLVICRAGAATLAELTATGVPAILIPYPYATGNHQEFNARFLEKAGAAIVIKDGLLTGAMLANQIENLLGDPGNLERMAGASKQLGRPQALKDILESLEGLLKRR